MEAEEFKRARSLLSIADKMGKAASKREIFTEAINRGYRKKVGSVFIKKLGKLAGSALKSERWNFIR